MKKATALLCFLLLASPAFAGTTRQAASCALEHVQAKVALSAAGDTVVIPAGPCDWTSKLTVTEGIKIFGMGPASTVITDKVAGDEMILLTTSAGKNFRIGNFGLVGNAAKGAQAHIEVGGAATGTWRLDHIALSNMQSYGIWTRNRQYGVVDSSTFVPPGVNKTGLFIEHDTWGGGTNGAASWTAAPGWGTNQFVFVEDCTFDGRSMPTAIMTAIDAVNGARYNFRWNTLLDANVSNHGTDSSGLKRSVRAFEVGHNTFTYAKASPYSRAVQIRGGAAVVHNNTATNFSNIIVPSTYRRGAGFNKWGGCDGATGYDLVDGEGAHDSGTSTGGDNQTTLKDSSKAWTPNEWIGFSLINVTKGLAGRVISANTADEITFEREFFNAYTFDDFDASDTYEIRKSTRCIDQPGAGASDLIPGNTDPPAPESWPNQAIDGFYNVSNTLGGAAWNLPESYPEDSLTLGTDYFNAAPDGYTEYQRYHEARDTTDPTLSITTPTSSATFSTDLAAITLSGPWDDDSGFVTGGTWTIGAASGAVTIDYDAKTWTAVDVPLAVGENAVEIALNDLDEGVTTDPGTDTITITRTSGGTPPTVAFTSPTSESTYETESGTIDLEGVATAAGTVVSVVITNSRGGTYAATGTTEWSAPGVVLQPSVNILTATVTDDQDATAIQTLTVTYTPPTPAATGSTSRVRLRN